MGDGQDDGIVLSGSGLFKDVDTGLLEVETNDGEMLAELHGDRQTDVA